MLCYSNLPYSGKMDIFYLPIDNSRASITLFFSGNNWLWLPLSIPSYPFYWITLVTITETFLKTFHQSVCPILGWGDNYEHLQQVCSVCSSMSDLYQYIKGRWSVWLGNSTGRYSIVLAYILLFPNSYGVRLRQDILQYEVGNFNLSEGLTIHHSILGHHVAARSTYASYMQAMHYPGRNWRQPFPRPTSIHTHAVTMHSPCKNRC